MITVVVPVYRAQNTLRALHTELTRILLANEWQYEILFVEDAGGDASWSVITEIAETDPNVRGIRLTRNFGQHNALLCGIRNAKGEIILTMDDDLQHPPEEIPKMIRALSPDVDVVYGYPRDDVPHGLLRQCASRLSKWALQTAMGVDSARYASAFRIFRTSLRDAFGDYYGPAANIDVMLTWGTTRFSAIPVTHNQRKEGASGYTFGKLLVHLLNMVTGFTALPLQIASMMGIAFSGFGFLLLLYVFINFLIRGGSVPGFTFLACAVTVLAGVELFALGMIGEYVSRIHFRTMGRPTFVVAEQTHTDSDANIDRTSV